jgi:hypothetical protein
MRQRPTAFERAMMGSSMPAPTKAKKSQAFPALDGMFLLTPDQHRTVAKDLRRPPQRGALLLRLAAGVAGL